MLEVHTLQAYHPTDDSFGIWATDVIVLCFFQVIPKCRSEPVAHSQPGVGLLLVEWTNDDNEVKLQSGDIKAKPRTFRVVLCTLNNGKLLPGWLAKVVQEYII